MSNLNPPAISTLCAADIVAKPSSWPDRSRAKERPRYDHVAANLGTRLVQLRRNREMGLGQLAKLAGIPMDRLRRMEKGQADASLADFIAVCAAMCVNPVREIRQLYELPA
jgi:hypothetical protein